MNTAMKIAKILLPVEFSDRCRGAARYGAALACHFQAQLVLLHVVPRVSAVYGGGGEVTAYCSLPDLPAEKLAFAQAQLEGFPSELPPNLRVCRVVLEGDPAPRVVEYAHDAKCDLIVMPTHAYGPFRRFLLGSVAAKVLHDVNCPVWTGPHLEQAPEWSRFAVRRVACALDLGLHSRAVLGWAAEMAASLGAELVILHAIPAHVDPQARRQLAQQAEKQIEAVKQDFEIRAETRVLAGDVAPAVTAAVREMNADVLVIGRSLGSGVLGRLRANAYAIIRDSPCPVASV